jgi:hypothetical protein
MDQFVGVSHTLHLGSQGPSIGFAHHTHQIIGALAEHSRNSAGQRNSFFDVAARNRSVSLT